MIYLIISILLNTLLFVIFKYFSFYKVNNLQAIVVNYLVAAFVGYFSNQSFTDIISLPTRPWLPGTIFLGVLFITLFNVLAITTQKGGLSVVSIASKMSVVIPVVFAFVVYKDHITLFKVIGIILALLAVYLVSKKTTSPSIEGKYLYLPVLLFLGSGILDTVLKYVETNYVKPEETNLYSATIFLIAGISGIIFMAIHWLITKNRFELKSVIAGIVLGIPNFYSIFFLLKALNIKGLESSYIFPVNNVGIVLLSAIVGVLLFNEKLTSSNKTGIVMAIFGIVFMSLRY